MNRRRLFGVTGILFFVFSVLLVGLGVSSVVAIIRDALFQLPLAIKNEASPLMQEVMKTYRTATFHYAVLTIAGQSIALINQLLIASIFFFLGRLFFRFRVDLEKGLQSSKEFQRLSLLFLAVYLVNLVSLLLKLKEFSFFRDPVPPALGMIGIENDPTLHMLIPQFGGASAIVVALLFYSAKCISSAYVDKKREAENLEREVSLTI